MNEKLTSFLWGLCFGAVVITGVNVARVIADETGEPEDFLQMEIGEAEKEWTPPADYVLPPAIGPAIAPALQDLPIPPGLTSLQFDTLRIALTNALRREQAITSFGLVVLTPPVLADPLKSLESWLRIARAANITALPSYAHGTPAWVLWRQLSTSPLTTEADWITFYRRLAA
ncbi:hypothetical protein [Geminisphaera colitermitum]|uniref:hypothetical protein n=1 Tax=Geminisphaera colitermitum TaxID=1148786 RepID=UPI000158D223|nr:hypothetical protein [Geminisphaera colitermitum]